MRPRQRIQEALRVVTGQEEFDELFRFLFHHERLLITRAAEVIEKLTLTNRGLLRPHKDQLIMLLRSAVHKELKWHLALLISRVELDEEECREAARVISYWALNPNESTRVRVNAMHGLYDLKMRYPALEQLFSETARALEHDAIAVLKARVTKLERLSGKGPQ